MAESAGHGRRRSTQKNTQRKLVTVACDYCRRKKLKCSGDRPACTRCAFESIPCHFDVQEEDTTRYAAQKNQITNLEQEVSQLHDLYSYLIKLPEPEAYDLFKKIRASSDPVLTLDYAKQLQMIPNQVQPADHRGDSRLRQIDHEAMRYSPIQVRATPWTVLVGDGILSELMSEFFAYEASYLYQFVEREALLKDMRSGDIVNAQYCSPLLINAICATRCMNYHRRHRCARIIEQDMTEMFLRECKKLHSLEQGRPSIPTAQAFIMLFVVEVGFGRDRAGSVYRYSAYDMLKRLDLEEQFRQLNSYNPNEFSVKQTISRLLWGFYATENSFSLTYNEPSLFPSPTIPRSFSADAESLNRLIQVTNASKPPGISVEYPKLVDGVLDTACDLALIANDAMSYEASKATEAGSAVDLAARKALYCRLTARAFPILENSKVDYGYQSCSLSMFSIAIALCVLRPLHSDTEFLDSRVTSGDLIVQFCQFGLTILEHFVVKYTTQSSPQVPLNGVYQIMIAMVAQLSHKKTHYIFGRTAAICRMFGSEFPTALVILRGIQAFAWSLQQTIPDFARPAFDNMVERSIAEDIPNTFCLPELAQVRALLAGTDGSSPGTSTELGTLIAKWSAMTGG